MVVVVVVTMSTYVALVVVGGAEGCAMPGGAADAAKEAHVVWVVPIQPTISS